MKDNATFPVVPTVRNVWEGTPRMPSKFPGTSAEVQNIVGKAVNRWRIDIKLQYQRSTGHAVTVAS